MKIYYFLIILVTQQYTLLGQTTWYVSNRNDGVVVDYTDLTTAYNAASPGDTIIIYPSPYTYSGQTVTKEIHFIGLGYHADPISQPSLGIKTFLYSAVIGHINFNSGSDNSTAESLLLGSMNMNNVSGCVVFRCETTSMINLEVSSNNYFRSCFLGGSGPPHSTHIRLDGSSNNVIENCIFSHLNLPNNITTSGYSTINTVAANNIFSGNTTLLNSFLYNNIYTSGNSLGEMNLVSNNVFFTGTPGTDENGNIYGATNVFVGYPTQGSYSFDSRWQLAQNSPALGAGVDGVDCGIFDGQYPYKLSGILSRPLIYELTVPPYVPDGSDLNITVKVRAEN